MDWDDIDKLNTARHRAYRKLDEAKKVGEASYLKDIGNSTNPCSLTKPYNDYLRSLETITDIVKMNDDIAFINGITKQLTTMIIKRS